MPRAWLSLLWAGPACALGSAAGHLRGWGHRPWNRRPSRSPRPRPASPAAIFPRLLLRLQCPEKAARLSLSGASERLLPATLSVWAQKTHHSRAQGWVFLTSTARSGTGRPALGPMSHPSARPPPLIQQRRPCWPPAPAPGLPPGKRGALVAGCGRSQPGETSERGLSVRAASVSVDFRLLTFLRAVCPCGLPAPVIFSVVCEARGP